MRCVCGHARKPHRHDRPATHCSRCPVPPVPTPLALDSIGVAAPGPEIIPGVDLPSSAVHDRFRVARAAVGSAGSVSGAFSWHGLGQGGNARLDEGELHNVEASGSELHAGGRGDVRGPAGGGVEDEAGGCG